MIYIKYKSSQSQTCDCQPSFVLKISYFNRFSNNGMNDKYGYCILYLSKLLSKSYVFLFLPMIDPITFIFGTITLYLVSKPHCHTIC